MAEQSEVERWRSEVLGAMDDLANPDGEPWPGRGALQDGEKALAKFEAAVSDARDQEWLVTTTTLNVMDRHVSRIDEIMGYEWRAGKWVKRDAPV